MLNVLRNYWGLALFGTVIGFMGAVSTATGTALTLFGLLFALIGGSLAPFFSKSPAAATAFNAANRRDLFSGLGLFSAGLLAGLVAGFTYQTVDAIWIDPLRMAPVEKRAASLEKLVGQLNDDRVKLAVLQAKFDGAVAQAQAQGQNGQAAHQANVAMLADIKVQIKSLTAGIDARLNEIKTQMGKIKPADANQGRPVLHAVPVEVTQAMLEACDGLLKYIERHPDDPKAKAARERVVALRDQIRFELDLEGELATVQALLDGDDKDRPLFANSDFGATFLRYKSFLTSSPPAGTAPADKK